MFHTNCINRWLKVTNSCPTCRTMIPPMSGDQPMGGACTLSTLHDKQINGFPDAHGYITIYYTVPNGVQDERHPSPGQLYSGTHRVAYLPNNRRGQTVGKMLQKAFEKLFIFKVGTSMTTGVSNTVVWSGLIPHKTSFHGGRD
uniref:E3 ubiquitin-protein ligase n=1 Tax=Romanomermis culicivorax TaxID=13658 RepID=A0A915I8Y7_ROMCU